jgi:hypothetical protein
MHKKCVEDQENIVQNALFCSTLLYLPLPNIIFSHSTLLILNAERPHKIYISIYIYILLFQ